MSRVLYITGIHALNLPCELETTGDWHTSSLDWKNVPLRESDNSPIKEWGIEGGIVLPDKREYNHANHLRAILDIMETGTEYELKWLGGFRDGFICTDRYNELFFTKVYCLKDTKKLGFDRFFDG